MRIHLGRRRAILRDVPLLAVLARNDRSRSSTLFAAMWLAVLCACSTTDPTPVRRARETFTVSQSITLQLPAPEVVIERLSETRAVETSSAEISSRIQRLAVAQVQQKGGRLAPLSAISTGPEPADSVGPGGVRETPWQRLARPNLGLESAVELLRRVCPEAPSGSSAALVHFARLKIADRRRWEAQGLPPIAFALVPRVGMSSSYVRAALRDCATGRLLWWNEVFLQELPEGDLSVFDGAVNALYQNLTLRKDS